MNIEDQLKSLSESQKIGAHNIWCEHTNRPNEMYYCNDYSEILQLLTIETALNSAYRRDDKYFYFMYNGSIVSTNYLNISIDDIIDFIGHDKQNLYLFPMLKGAK